MLSSNRNAQRRARFKNILRLACAEILFLDGKSHAAVDSAVTLVEAKKLPHYKGLANAVLRRIASEGKKN